MTRLLWALVVWAVVAGGITRVAAVKFARDERISTSALLKFTGRKFVSFFAAPLLALAAIGLFRAIGLLGGLVGLIPYVGAIVVGAFWILALVLGLILALVVIGGVAGWPLMYATISVENSDAFDGFSRSYSYVYSRPWQYASNAIVAVAYGALLMVLVSVLADFAVYLSGWSVAGGLSGGRLAKLFEAAPEVFRSTADSNRAGSQDAYPVVATGFVSFWLHLVAALVNGFAVSYFWTASTIMYFLLRRSDDATDFDHIQMPDGDEKDELLPLVGVAASEQPVIERLPGRVKPAEEESVPAEE